MDNTKRTLTVLDASTLGSDLSLDLFSEFGSVTVYETTSPAELRERIAESDVLLLNKVKISAEALDAAPRLKLICIAATGYDNIDLAACRAHGVAVCNVPGYSTDSVAQITLTLALALASRLKDYTPYVDSGAYSVSGVANKVAPPYHELAGQTWGVVGLGAIGGRVAAIARAMGCRVIACKRTPVPDYPCVSLDTLCCEADVISLHTPLTDETRGMINAERLAMMKPSALLINVARGAVTDEKAVADAILTGRLGGLGCDVYTAEPFPTDHPYYPLRECPNVILTPHMAWASCEARERCVGVMADNIRAFYGGASLNRIV